MIVMLMIVVMIVLMIVATEELELLVLACMLAFCTTLTHFDLPGGPPQVYFDLTIGAGQRRVK